MICVVPEHAGRGHLRQPGQHLAELGFQRRRDGRGHGLRDWRRDIARSRSGSGIRRSAAAPPAAAERRRDPASKIAAVSSDVAIGRRMKGVEMLIARCPEMRAGQTGAMSACVRPAAARLGGVRQRRSPFTRVPGASRDCPLTTTFSPPDRPLVITAVAGVLIADLTGCCLRPCWSGLTR